MVSKDSIRNLIKAESEKLGFCFCGFTSADPLSDIEIYLDWLEQNHQGDMSYLSREDHIAKRADPRLLMEGCQSIIVLGMPIAQPPAERLQTAAFAHYLDYHQQLPERCHRLMNSVNRKLAEPLAYQVMVDSAPVLERSLAVRAGLGWIGKSSMFIHPTWGSFVLLCEIFVSLACHDQCVFPKPDRCGNCTRCASSCPTKCIDPVARTIDAKKCIAYLTIEKKGLFDEQETAAVSTHLFGCDICTAVCPWNRTLSSRISPMAPFQIPVPDTIVSEETFAAAMKGSCFERLRFSRWQRNVAVVKKNLMREIPA